MSESCGCCSGIEALTPEPIHNRPGLPALAYRVGTHASFLATMQARLSSHTLEVERDHDGALLHLSPLRGLSTRDADDPAIALLDAWATIADVLSFYQERIANEGFLRTATERRSVLELARLVGYRPRPGVAASAYLAYQLETGFEVTIPAHSLAQSVPGPGELPQPFETSKPLAARASWNALRPRQTRPQRLSRAELARGGVVYFKGLSTGLRPNDPLLLGFGDGRPELYRVRKVEPSAPNDRSAVTVEPWAGLAAVADAQPVLTPPFRPAAPAPRGIGDLLGVLEKPPSRPPANAAELSRTLEAAFAPGADTSGQVVGALRPTLARRLYTAWRNLPPDPQRVPLSEAFAPRTRAKLFGSSAPQRARVPRVGQLIEYVEWPLEIGAPLPFEVTALLIPAEQPGDGYGYPPYGYGPYGYPAPPLATFATRVILQFGNQNPVSSELLPVPPLGQRLEANLSVGELSVRLTLEHRQDGLLRVTIGVREGRSELDLLLDISAERGDFSASTATDQFVRVEVIGDQNRLQELARADELLPQVAIQASGVLRLPTENASEAPDALSLDAQYSQILPDTWVAVERPTPSGLRVETFKVTEVAERARADYGVSGRSTQLRLDDVWLRAGDSFATIRDAAIYAQSEPLVLAEEPIPDPIPDPAEGLLAGKLLELQDLVDGLESGRWLIVAGERADLGVDGIHDAELAMLAGVEQMPSDGGPVFSRLTLAEPLAFRYKRATAEIFANVAHATHGETLAEVLGSGDASQELQRFVLRQKPLTYVSAPTPSGIESTLEVFVDKLRWHEAETLFGLGPAERRFVTSVDDEDSLSVIFGDGRHGARPSTGRENITASYRRGIGQPGNVAAGQISQLASRPLGVRSVNNPLRASGGADRESRDSARRNTPLATAALGRLVAVRDYQDFARTFAGIGKASAVRLPLLGRQVLHLTIAGADDIPIDPTSDLFQNLRLALARFGDPALPVQVATRELQILVLQAGVAMHPDYLWEDVEARLRAALLAAFSFEQRALGQDALRAEAIAVAQAVAGVTYIDLDVFGAFPEREPQAETDARGALLALDSPVSRTVLQPDAISAAVQALVAQAETPEGLPQRVRARLADVEGRAIRAAELAILLPTVADTLILRRLP
jgi:predicted phage baseplate assembly protein